MWLTESLKIVIMLLEVFLENRTVTEPVGGLNPVTSVRRWSAAKKYNPYPDIITQRY